MDMTPLWFWQHKASEWPELSQYALSWLSLPAGLASVEQFLSVLKRQFAYATREANNDDAIGRWISPVFQFAA